MNAQVEIFREKNAKSFEKCDIEDYNYTLTIITEAKCKIQGTKHPDETLS
jgi:hypothetical protein